METLREWVVCTRSTRLRSTSIKQRIQTCVSIHSRNIIQSGEGALHAWSVYAAVRALSGRGSVAPSHVTGAGPISAALTQWGHGQTGLICLI